MLRDQVEAQRQQLQGARAAEAAGDLRKALGLYQQAIAGVMSIMKEQPEQREELTSCLRETLVRAKELQKRCEDTVGADQERVAHERAADATTLGSGEGGANECAKEAVAQPAVAVSSDEDTAEAARLSRALETQFCASLPWVYHFVCGVGACLALES